MTRRSRFDWLLLSSDRLGRAAKSRRPAVPGSRRLRFEPLEDRRLLSITVNTLVDENNGIGVGGISLREAIAAAPAGDTINFSVTGTINLTNLGQLVVNKNLTIVGPGASLLTINAFDPTPAANNGDGNRIFNIDDGTATVRTVSISGLTLANGDTSGTGVAIRTTENLTLSSSALSGNVSSVGGGLYNVGASAVATLNSVTVSNNIAGFGGGLFNGFGTLNVVNSTINANGVSGNGGGIQNNYGTLAVTNSTITGNDSIGIGGGILTYFDVSTTVTSSTIVSNTAVNGGGIWGRNSHITVVSSTISGNGATNGGGGVYLLDGSLTVRHSTVAKNRADLDLDGGGRGGGVWVASGSATIDHTIVALNIRGVSERDDIFGTLQAGYSLIGDRGLARLAIRAEV